MRELELIELEKVSGASLACLAASVFLGVSPLGGPMAIAGAVAGAVGACLPDDKPPKPDPKDGNDYCQDGGNY